MTLNIEPFSNSAAVLQHKQNEPHRYTKVTPLNNKLWEKAMSRYTQKYSEICYTRHDIFVPKMPEQMSLKVGCEQ